MAAATNEVEEEILLTEDDLPELEAGAPVEGIEARREDLGADGRGTERSQGARPRRRRGPDELSQAPDWVSAAGWGIAMLSFVLFGLAKPAGKSMFDRFMAVDRGAELWDQGLLRGALALNVIAILTAVLAFGLNTSRMQRAEDRLRLAPLVLLVACVAGIFGIADKI